MSNFVPPGRGSNTFEFGSGYPRLNMPAYPLARSSYADPTNANCLLDGEWCSLDINSVEGNPKQLIRGFDNGATDAYVGIGGAAGHISNQHAWITRGLPGRSDAQVSGAKPWVRDDNFEFKTRLHEGNLVDGGGQTPRDPVPGEFYYIALGNLLIDGTTYTGRTFLRSANAVDAGAGNSYYVVCSCVEAPTDDGFARFFARKEHVTLPVIGG